MKILKMRATFGKLQSAELALGEGLNVIEAPNEGGQVHLVGLPAGHALRDQHQGAGPSGLPCGEEPLPALERRGHGGERGAALAGAVRHPPPGAQGEHPLWPL